jgi:sec-independent protein translocase protein TatA
VFSQLGPLEIVLIVVVLLVIFGPKRLPGLGRSLGSGLREFKDSITGDEKQRETDATGRPVLTQAQAEAAQQPAPAAESAPEQRG